MTKPIKLPPLPEPKFIKKGEIPSISLIEHEYRMREYGQQCATAAIEVDRQTTKKQFAAYKRLTESLESRVALLQNQYDQLKKATDPSLLESERAANAILTAELQADRQARGEPVELKAVPETIAEGGGFWRSCTGCHETNEGYATGPYSKTLKCHLGVGCSECGGIGAIWDTTDYDAMAYYMAQSMGVTQTQQQAGEPCLTCNDNGAVGNILNAEPCPDCTPQPSSGGVCKNHPQQISDEWKQAIDHELVTFGSTADSYSSPKEAIESLIYWNVFLATDPLVNGGFKLVPIDPTDETL